MAHRSIHYKPIHFVDPLFMETPIWSPPPFLLRQVFTVRLQRTAQVTALGVQLRGLEVVSCPGQRRGFHGGFPWEHMMDPTFCGAPQL